MTTAKKVDRSPFRVNSLTRVLTVLGNDVEKGYDNSRAEVAQRLLLPEAPAFLYLQTPVASGSLCHS